jgi:putative transposase
MALVRSALKLRLAPTRDQEELLLQFAGARRWVWNWALGERHRSYAETGRPVSWSTLSARLTAMKREPQTRWLQDMDSQALQQALADLGKAFNAFLAGDAGLPRWRSRKTHRPTFRIPQRIGVTQTHIRVPKVGLLRLLQTPRAFAGGVTKSATFRQSASGKWYASVVVEWECEEGPLPLPDYADRVSGIDLGLTTYAVLSSGEKVANPRFGRVGDRTIRLLNQKLARQVKGSNNRARTKRRLALAHERIANQRRDFAHQLTTRLLDDHDGVCIEDLAVSGLARTKLARSVLDAAWSEVKRQLAYKAPRRRKYLGWAGRFEASTKECSVCHARAPELALGDRTWTCPRCGICHHRDENAAAMVKWLGYGRYRPHASGTTEDVAAGRSETQNACGAAVRPADRAGSLP